MPVCVCAQVGCYSYRLLIDPDNWQGAVECEAAIGSARSEGQGRVSERRLSARTRTQSTFTLEKSDANTHAPPPPVRPGAGGGRRLRSRNSGTSTLQIACNLQSNALAVGFGILKGHKVPFFVVTKTVSCPLNPLKKTKKKYRRQMQAHLLPKRPAWLFSQSISALKEGQQTFVFASTRLLTICSCLFIVYRFT